MSNTTQLTQINAEIALKGDELESAKADLANISTAPITAYRAAKQKAEGGYCADKYSLKNRRRDCQADADAERDRLKTARDRVLADQSTIRSTISNLENEIDQLNSQADTLQQQMTDPELIEANANASAVQTQANQEAQNNSLSARRKNMIYLAIAAVVLIIAGIFVYKKFIK